MNDFGMGAAINASLQIFEQSSRQSGRTEAMIRAVQPGDQIVTHSADAKRHIENRLRAAGKGDVKVYALSPRSKRGLEGVRIASGATHFDNSWFYELYRARIEDIRKEADALRAMLSRQEPRERDMSPIERNWCEADIRGWVS